MSARGNSKRLVVCCTLALAALLPGVSHASFPGQNGRIVFSGFDQALPDAGEDLYTTLPDGSDLRRVTTAPAHDHLPAWAPGGARLAFVSGRDADAEIYTVNVDGSNLQRLTNNLVEDTAPAWSPDGSRIAFQSDRDRHSEIYVMNTDGTGVTRLTNQPGQDRDPDWSPDGRSIAFVSFRRIGLPEIFRMNIDGSSVARVSTGGPGGCVGPGEESHFHPSWAPDGSQIAYTKVFVTVGHECGDEWLYRIAKVNADGTGQTDVTLGGFQNSRIHTQPAWSPDGTRILFQDNSELSMVDAGGGNLTSISPLSAAGEPAWEAVPVNTASTHVRPKGAQLLRVPLVPAYGACTSPNRTHGPPLAHPSCAPPQHRSPNLTVGVGDGSPALSRSVGFVQLKAKVGVPGDPDDTDVNVRFSLSNVMRSSDLSEYTGELRAAFRVRLTDRHLPVSETTQDFPLEFDVPCVPTAAELDKSLCDLFTTVDALIPGAAAEGTRAVWALDQVKVYDGGPDEDAGTTGDNSLFAVQGVFVP